MAKDKPVIHEKILYQSMEDVMHNSIMPYAEYIILERSLPRVEDGLKPVQRRILYTMLELGITPDKAYRKSARIVGDCLGKYHPHGDTSVYDAMVRMAQPYNMREMLVDGHGNFGSIDGDSAAAMRYTEARMMPIAMELLKDIEKETVPFKFNFDDSLKEPELLPGRYPNLLVNGAQGIAIGVATNIPQHNLEEVIDGVIAQMENPDISFESMMDIVKGPDFPTGGLLFADEDMFRAYETGRGKVALRAKVSTETQSNGKINLVITELPYQVNKAVMLERVLKVSEDKKELLSCITDIRDESDRDGMRAVIELKKDSNVKRTLDVLYKFTDLQISYSVNMVAIADGKPKQMGIMEINNYYIKHQKTVVRARLTYDLENAKKREHILTGLMIAVNNIDEVIALIKSSKNPDEARKKLCDRFEFTKVQAQAVLDMRLQRLTALQINTLKKEYAEILKLISYLESVLKSEKKLIQLVITELNEIKEKYKNKRRTKIIWDQTSDIEIPDIKEEKIEEAIIVITHKGMIKRVSDGVYGNLVSEPDCDIAFSIKTTTDKTIYLFTNYGFCYSINPADIVECKQKDNGTRLRAMFLDVESDESIVAVFENMGNEDILNFYTTNGMIKRSFAKEYITRKSRIAAITLKDNSRLLNIEVSNTEKSIFFVTKNGMSINFSLDGINPTGRVSAGVKAIKLDLNDSVIFAGGLLSNQEVFVLSDRGYGKKSMAIEYDLQNRGGKGLKTFDFKPNHSNGNELAFAMIVDQNEKLDVVSKNGDKTQISTGEFKIEPRYSKGVSSVIVLMDNVIITAYKCL